MDSTVLKIKLPLFLSVLAIVTIFPAKMNGQEIDESPSGLVTDIGADTSVNFIKDSGFYQGYVEAGYSHSMAGYNADMVSLQTSQGYRFNPWFYLGAGTGIDILAAHKSKTWGQGWENAPGFNVNHPATGTAVLLPLFGDFKFLIGNEHSNYSFFLDLKVGCSFLLSNKYISIKDGFLTDKNYFYLDPSIGLRIPVNANNPKQAVNVSVNYKLLTSSYWNYVSNNITLQFLGASISYEW